MNINRDELFKLSSDILAAGKGFCFQARGESMRPFIMDGDILEIAPVDGRQIRLGDVIFYRIEENPVTAHRVIKRAIEEGKIIFIAKGDSNVDKGERVSIEHVMGRVEAIERNGKRLYINNGFNRIKYIFYTKVYAFCKCVGGRILPHIQGLKLYPALAKKLIKRDFLYQCECSESGKGCILAKKDGIVIGRVDVHNSLERGAPQNGWWISGMWVDWRYRRLGIAKQLTQLSCDFAAQNRASEVKLFFFSNSKPALGLYQKMGFYPEERDKTPQERIIMKKAL